MFLRNFWDFVRLNAYGSNDYNKNGYINYPTSARDQLNNPLGYLYIDSKSGTSTTPDYPTNPSTYSDSSTWNKYMEHVFYAFNGLVGTGSTAVTANDYKLDNDVTNQFTSTSTTMAYAVNNDGHFVITITWTGFNNSNSPITITEVGAKRFVQAANSPSDANNRWTEILVFRRVLTTPIVVAAKTNTTIVVSCELY